VKVSGGGSSRAICAGVPDMRPVVFPPVSDGREEPHATGPGFAVLREALIGYADASGDEEKRNGLSSTPGLNAGCPDCGGKLGATVLGPACGACYCGSGKNIRLQQKTQETLEAPAAFTRACSA
jgi:hypothetical protein